MIASVNHSKPSRFGPSPQALAFSAAIHGAILSWVVFGPPLETEKPKSLYQQVIAGKERKLIWYRFRDRLPEVSPAGKKGSLTAPQVETKIKGQTIVANPPNAPRANQMVWQPVPKLKIERELQSPNLLAFQTPQAPPPPERPQPKVFTPPEIVKRVPAPTPSLGAPQIEVAVDQAPRSPWQDKVAEALAVKPKPREFVPPAVVKRTPGPAAAIPAAPKVELALNTGARVPLNNGISDALSVKPKPKQFVPPVVVKRTAGPAPSVPAAPKVELALNTRAWVPLNDDISDALSVKPKPKQFVPPAGVKRTTGPAPTIPAAPRVDVALDSNAGAPFAGDISNALGVKPKPKLFVPPEHPRAQGSAPAIDEAPRLAASNSLGDVSLAVVGLNPVARMDMPVPEGSRAAKFSAGPEKPERPGGAGSVETARIVVPDLMIRGGARSGNKEAAPTLMARAAPTSRETLMAAAKSMVAPEPPKPVAAHVSTVPDPRFEGRSVYLLAIQMPNITSYIGSWMLWYAEMAPIAGATPQIHPPEPLRKVDPKYVPSAVAERVEGKVQLSAVIRRDGRVDSVALLKPLDERLDQSAAEAFRKWEFKPAIRDGTPIDVDAVVEIPFRLAPRATR